MTKHTPGPWYISETGPRYSINAGTGGDSTRHIAMVSSYEKFEEDKEENIANSKLMAAAPDLLEALETILLRIDGRYDSELLVKQGYLGNTLDDIQAYARQAIAKAKGQ